jgi:hypothetical protein
MPRAGEDRVDRLRRRTRVSGYTRLRSYQTVAMVLHQRRGADAKVPGEDLTWVIE